MHPKIRKLLWIFSRTFVTKSKTTMPDPPPPTTHNMNECRRKKHMHLRSNRLIPPAAPPAGRRILVKRGCIGGTAEARLSAAITAVTNGSPLSVCFFCHFWPPVAGVQLFTGEPLRRFAHEHLAGRTIKSVKSSDLRGAFDTLRVGLQCQTYPCIPATADIPSKNAVF